MPVRELIQEHRDSLTATERRVATVVLDDAQSVAFGTVAAIDRRALASTVTRLSSPRAHVVVLPGSASFGVGYHLAEQLGMLRDDVDLAWGAPAPVTATLAALGASDVVVAIDLPRYDVAV